MDLIVYFNKKILGQIKGKLSEITNMHSINIVHFCSVVLQKISKGNLNSVLDENLVSMLCQIFDCVDVDSRGIIHWDDFVSFALRSGRNSFKPISGYINVEYVQRMDINAVMPVKKLYHCPETNLLYAFDGDSPVVRCIRQSGDQVGTFNPVIGITRLIKVRQQGKQPYFAKKNTAKQDAGKLKKKKENVLKQTVTSMTWIDRKRQMVFATSNSYLSFWNSRLVHLIDFVETVAPQLGMLYSNSADVLLTWAGDKVNYDYSVWDCNSRTLRYQFNMHKSIILTTVEMSSLGAIVSSSIDRALYMWPISKLLEGRDASFDDKKLVGHTYAIRSVCFAPQNDLIIGAGFDFDIFCWDPTTSSLQMKLVGHRLSIVSVATVNNPFERAASVDESGCVKIWNIDRAQGMKGSHLQSIILQGAVPNHVFSFISAFESGGMLVCLSEKLLFIELTSTAMEDNRLVTGGLSVCEQNSRIVVTSRKSAFEYSLVNGDSGKVYNLVSEECIETCSTAKMVLGVEMGMAKRATEIKHVVNANEDDEDDDKGDRMTSQVAMSMMNKGSRNIYPDDDVTCVSCDQGGKKFFCGTNSGRVLMYDGTSLGLLAQLSHEERLSRRDDHNSGGAVVMLKYCERDEVLVAAFAGGAVKVFTGCYRVVTEDTATTVQSKTATEIAELLCPFFQGGGPPQTPLLLRQNTRVHETTVLAMDVSDKLGLIAVSAVDGTVRVFDYHTLLIRSICAVPFVGSQPVEVIHLSFMPLAPVLVGADSNGRFTAWTVYPMKPMWILTWSLQTCFTNTYSSDPDASSLEENDAAEDDTDGDNCEGSTSESMSAKKSKATSRRRHSMLSVNSFASLEDDRGEEVSNAGVVSSMQCVVWKTRVRTIKTSSRTPGRIHWNIVVGEGNGMISIIDVTDMMEKLGLHDFTQLKQARQLNSSALVYQTVRRSDIKDGLEDFQIREVEKRVRHPVGFNCFSPARDGCKNISNKDMKGVVRWNAHPHGVGEIVCKQHELPCQIHSRSHQKAFQTINAKFKTQDYENIPGCPYVVVSSSEYGVPKRWTWTGQLLSDEYAGDMLQQAIESNTKVVSLALEEQETLDGPKDLPNHPSGGAAQRLANIAEWALPLIKTRFSEMRANDAQFDSLAGNNARFATQGRDSPADDGKLSPNNKPGGKGGGNMSDDEDDESSVMNLLSPSKKKNGPKSPFAKDIVSIRRRVNEDKQRKEFSNQCWDSKDRFPNHNSELKKSEHRRKDQSEEEVRELLGLIEEVKDTPPPIKSSTAKSATLSRSYSSFIQKRNAMHSSVHKKIDNLNPDRPASTPKVKTEGLLEVDTTPHDSGEITERDLFMCDIRQLRPSSSIHNAQTSSPPTSPTGRDSRGIFNANSPPLSPPRPLLKAMSSRRVKKNLLAKSDSYNLFSTRNLDLGDAPEDEDELRELGLTIRRRDRVKASRSESILSIEATMRRFDKITSTNDKKYSYTFNHEKVQLQRGKKKHKQVEKLVHEDHGGGSGGYEDKPQENGAGRYGPYKGRDIAAFEDFMSRIPHVQSSLDRASITFRFGDYFGDVLGAVRMGLVYDMSEVMPVVMGLNNKPLANLIKDLNVRLDGTFLRENLFTSVFSFASNCERIRIYKFSMIRTVLIEVFRTLSPPPVEPVEYNTGLLGGKGFSPGGRSPTAFSPSRSRFGNTALLSETSQSQSFHPSHQQDAQKKHFTSLSRNLFKDKSSQAVGDNKSLSSDQTPPVPIHTTATASANTNTAHSNTFTPYKNNTSNRQGGVSATGLEGWSMTKATLDDLKLLFEDFFQDRNGTVVGTEVVEISQFACSSLPLDKPPNMPFLALRRSFPLHVEVNGELIAQFFEDVLRLEIREDNKDLLHEDALTRARIYSSEESEMRDVM